MSSEDNVVPNVVIVIQHHKVWSYARCVVHAQQLPSLRMFFLDGYVVYIGGVESTVGGERENSLVWRIILPEFPTSEDIICLAVYSDERWSPRWANVLGRLTTRTSGGWHLFGRIKKLLHLKDFVPLDCRLLTKLRIKLGNVHFKTRYPYMPVEF